MLPGHVPIRGNANEIGIAITIHYENSGRSLRCPTLLGLSPRLDLSSELNFDLHGGIQGLSFQGISRRQARVIKSGRNRAGCGAVSLAVMVAAKIAAMSLSVSFMGEEVFSFLVAVEGRMSPRASRWR